MKKLLGGVVLLFGMTPLVVGIVWNGEVVRVYILYMYLDWRMRINAANAVDRRVEGALHGKFGKRI